ncbi:GIY-YIG nuclease family protein, partial [bacterium]|nr:GIY-YIG nuclease family protein [bacterium]
SGVWIAEIMNWTGQVIVCPRSNLEELAKREEAKRTGIYCLTGTDPEQTTKQRVYVGEADSILYRLKEHLRDEKKDFWERTVLVSSKDLNLTKAHVRYLEARVLQLTKSANRANLANGTAPDPPMLPESDIADMEYFIDQLELIFPVLGFQFLKQKQEVFSQITTMVAPQVQFVMKQRKAEATAVEFEGEFLVLKGSKARVQGTKSWDGYIALRDQLVEDQKLILSADSEFYEFTENVPFSSPSAAATIVAAHNMNGRAVWYVKDSKKTYGEWLEEKISDSEQLN